MDTIFDGSTARRRPIRLGGSSQTQISRREELEKKREARRRRGEERAQQEAATVLQGQWRSRSARRAELSALAARWDAFVRSVLSNASGASVSSVDARRALQCAARLFRAHRHRPRADLDADGHRCMSALRILLEVTCNDTGKSLTMAFVDNMTLVDSAIVKSVLHAALLHATRTPTAVNSALSDAQCTALLAMFVRLADAVPPSTLTSLQRGNARTAVLLADGIAKLTFASDEQKQLAHVLLLVADRTLGTVGDSDSDKAALRRFAAALWTRLTAVPLLLTRIKRKESSALLISLLARALDAGASVVEPQEEGAANASWRGGNLVQFVRRCAKDDSLRSLSPTGFAVLLEELAISVSGVPHDMWPIAYGKQWKERTPDDGDDDEEEADSDSDDEESYSDDGSSARVAAEHDSLSTFTSTSTSSNGARARSERPRKSKRTAARCVQVLLPPALLPFLGKQLKDTVTSIATLWPEAVRRSEGGGAVEAIRQFCALFNSAGRVMRIVDGAFYDKVCTHRALLRNLFAALSSDTELLAYLRPTHLTTLGAFPTALESQLTMFVRGMRRSLFAASDDDVFGGTAVLNVDEIAQFCGWLRIVVFRMHWCSAMGVTRACRRQCTLLLRDLYDRHARRPFTKADLFTLSEISVVADANIEMIEDEEERGADDDDDDHDDDDDDVDEGGDARMHAHTGAASALRLGARSARTRHTPIRSQVNVRRLAKILRHVPFTVPFEARIRLFRAFLQRDRAKHYDVRSDFGFGNDVHLRVERDAIVETSMSALRGLADTQWKQRFRVQFVTAHGTEERGIDGGGLLKEWLSHLLQAGFAVPFGLFVETGGAVGRSATERALYPNPAASALFDTDEMDALYEFLGCVLGKCIYSEVLVELPLANFFLARLLGKRVQLDDLHSLDAELYRNLMWLRRYEGDVEELGLNFSVQENRFGDERTIELIANGANVAVTRANVVRYCHLVAHHRLNVQIRRQSTAFLRGFTRLIESRWLRMFSQHELQYLIAGAAGGFDVNELRRHTVYSNGFSAEHPTIEAFWRVVRSMDAEQQRQLLRFVTSCSRPPLLGFAHLHPPFTISMAHREMDGAQADALDEYLPTASTCVNLLKLMPFRNEEKLRAKLLYAIGSNAGFEMS